MRVITISSGYRRAGGASPQLRSEAIARLIVHS
jgi:hypothetical protein